MPPSPSRQKHLSSFPLTSHLHQPHLRLVSLHPLLSVSLTFLRVPEIHDEFVHKFFISRTSTIEQVIDMVMEVLGLAKSLPIPGAGTIEYVIEETWTDGSRESKIQSLLL